MYMLYRVFALSAVLLLLVVSGCLQPPAPEPEFMRGSELEPLEFTPVSDTTIAPAPAPIPGNCEAMERQVDKDACALNTALEESDESQCLALSELWQRNSCITSVARAKLDTAVCANMGSAFGADNTNVKNSCIAAVALEVLFTDECRELAGAEWETGCWSRLLGVCNQISSGEWRELCIKKGAIEAGDPEKCMQLHGFEKDTCLEEIAAAYQNQGICSPIGDEAIKESCLERAGKGYWE
jgi:hypothetical protein